MQGQSSYFAGQLEAEATIGRGRPVAFKDAPGRGERPAGGSGGRRHGGGGAENGRGRADRGDDDGTPTLHLTASHLPPVTLRVKLTNHAKAALDIQIREVKSDLGDFAARPERVLLAPEQSVELDPMISQLGLPADELPLTLSLRLAGQTETRDLLLRPIHQATNAP